MITYLTLTQKAKNWFNYGTLQKFWKILFLSLFSEKNEDTRIFILRIPDLYTLQRKMQRLMMQTNIQIRSTIANVHKNPIITVFFGHIFIMNYLQEEKSQVK